MKTMRKIMKLNLYINVQSVMDINISDNLKHSWLYLSFLYVPEYFEDEFINRLKQDSVVSTDASLFYNELSLEEKEETVRRWIEYCREEQNKTYFYMLGINQNNFNISDLSDKSNFNRVVKIYNQFFQYQMMSVLKNYFAGFDYIVLNSISSLNNIDKQKEHYFPWKIFNYLSLENTKFQSNIKEMDIVDYNHDNTKDKSYPLQYLEIISSLFHNCIHFKNYNDIQLKLSLEIYPLIDRILNQNNEKAMDIRKRININFFPKHKINSLDELDFLNESLLLFRKRDLKIQNHFQPTLC